jgi:hypothetical protein
VGGPDGAGAAGGCAGAAGTSCCAAAANADREKQTTNATLKNREVAERAHGRIKLFLLILREDSRQTLNC